MEGGGLLGQLGIDWKLLLSQAVNFFILLLVLWQFVYKPLIRIIKERNKKITEGLTKAAEADTRLKEIDNIAKDRIKTAEQQSLGIIQDTQERAKELEITLQKKAEEKQAQVLLKIAENYKKQQEEIKRLVFAEAGNLVKKAIVKTVELNPKAVDEALIEKAISEIEK
jgi:F-type H+-transporting ATPase subunit b